MLFPAILHKLPVIFCLIFSTFCYTFLLISKRLSWRQRNSAVMWTELVFIKLWLRNWKHSTYYGCQRSVCRGSWISLWGNQSCKLLLDDLMHAKLKSYLLKNLSSTNCFAQNSDIFLKLIYLDYMCDICMVICICQKTSFKVWNC